MVGTVFTEGSVLCIPAGYLDQDNATVAAYTMKDLVLNGTLASALAAKGWPGVMVSIIGTITTGKTISPKKSKLTSQPYLLPVYAGAGAGGLAFIALVAALVYWIIKRRRRRAAAASQGGTASALQRPLAAYADRGSSAGGTGSASSSEGGGGPSYQAPGQFTGRSPGWSPLGPQQQAASGGWGGRGQSYDFQPMSAPNSPPVSGGGRGEAPGPDDRPSAPPLEQQRYAGVKSPAHYGDSAGGGYGVQQQQRVPMYPPVPPPQQQQPGSGRSSPALHPAGGYGRARPSSPLGVASRAGIPDSVPPVHSEGQVAAGLNHQGRQRRQ